MYVDYTYYQNSFYGNVIPQSDFKRYENKGRGVFNSSTFNRIKTLYDDDDSILSVNMKDCVCELAENFYKYESREGINSESNSILRVDYNDKKLNKINQETLNKYLWDTGYLYSGFTTDEQ